MDFRRLNRLNIRMNILSGNLLPMTPNKTEFCVYWKIYSYSIWVMELIRAGALIPGVILYTSTAKGLIGFLVAIFIAMEVIFLVSRIHSHDVLMRQLIQKLNDILRNQDETMKNVVMATLLPMKTPLNFYWSTGLLGTLVWYSLPLTRIFKKSTFYYKDFGLPIVISKQPFSTEIFVLGNLLVLFGGLYMFSKKVAVNIYMIHLVLLITAQYRYVAVKLEQLFQQKNLDNESDSQTESHPKRTNSWAEREIKAMCRHYNTVIHLSFMLKKLLALNFSVIYMNTIFRLCFLGIIMSTAFRMSFIQGFVASMTACADTVQFYTLCSSVQQLLDASSKVTDLAFHKNWYQFGISIKRTFLLLILGNTLECKLAAYDKYNLSLSSFMTVMNQAYTVALLFLRMK